MGTTNGRHIYVLKPCRLRSDNCGIAEQNVRGAPPSPDYDLGALREARVRRVAHKSLEHSERWHGKIQRCTQPIVRLGWPG